MLPKKFLPFNLFTIFRIKILPFLTVVAAILVFWKILSLLFSSPILPPPLEVFYAIISMWKAGTLLPDVITSIERVVIGFLLAAVVGGLIGIIASRFARTYSYLSYFIELLRSIPPIAWTPIAILWFGIGDKPAYFIVFLGAFFPLFTNIYHGICSVDTELVDAAKTLGASKTLILKDVVFQSALPDVLAGFKAGMGVAWFNVIAAELIGSQAGLGYKIQLNRYLSNTEDVVGLMIVIGIVGFSITALISLLNKILVPWTFPSPDSMKWRAWQQKVSNFLMMPIRIIEKIKQNHFGVPGDLVFPGLQFEEIKIVSIIKCFLQQNKGKSVKVLDNISFSVKRGEIFSIVGPNGCGKSTLIRIIAGLLAPDEGNVYLNGEKIVKPTSDRTVIFQDFALFPWKTALQNVEFAIRASQTKNERNKLSREKRINMAENKLAQAGLIEFKNNYPSELSVGMRQKLAIARALVVKPNLLLMDEPFASLDPIAREKHQEETLALLESTQLTVILVTHSLDEAIFLGDRILVLTSRPAKVKALIDVKMSKPKDATVRMTREFQELKTEIWSMLREELLLKTGMT